MLLLHPFYYCMCVPVWRCRSLRTWYAGKGGHLATTSIYRSHRPDAGHGLTAKGVSQHLIRALPLTAALRPLTDTVLRKNNSPARFCNCPIVCSFEVSFSLSVSLSASFSLTLPYSRLPILTFSLSSFVFTSLSASFFPLSLSLSFSLTPLITFCKTVLGLFCLDA